MADEFKFRVTNMNQVLRGLGDRTDLIEVAASYAVAQVGLALERETKKTLNNNPHTRKGKQWIPKGHIGGAGTPPNRRSGNLLSSVRTETRKGLGTYTASVFPTMIYARRLEVGLNYPYLRPSAERIRPIARQIFMTNFIKKWRA